MLPLDSQWWTCPGAEYSDDDDDDDDCLSSPYCYNFMIFLLCILQHKDISNTKFEFNISASFRDLNF